MMDAGRHPLIDLVTMAEVIGCEGEPGNFRVRIRKNPRFVKEDLCTACGACAEKCYVISGNEFDLGLKARKAIYRPYPQSVPSAYVIDKEACKECWLCVKACQADAIDLDMQAEEFEVSVGAILVAVGFQEFDARKLKNYGYGRFPNVVTSLELERMLNPTGVTRGHVVRPSDMRTPKRIVFIQCVGARGEGGRPYCSRFCCMNAVKDSMLIRQHDPEVEEITILYTDIRAFGKGFDDFVRRAFEEQSARFIRGRPAKVDYLPEEDSLEVFVEDTLEHKQNRIPADLVVLSIAAAPNDGAIKLAEILGIETDEYGFIKKRDPAISAVETNREGIYVCGSAGGPQVIPDAVSQASAVAARAQLFLTGARAEETTPEVPEMDVSGEPRIGVMICHCGINIAGVLNIDDLVSYARGLPGVVVAKNHMFACSATGQDEMIDLINEHKLNRMVICACTPRTHEPVFRDTCSKIGFNPYLLEMVNIRDQCSWVHDKNRISAQQKAKDLIRMGVARARHLEPLLRSSIPVTRSALVIGGGIAGIQCATDLAEQGFPTILVEKESELGGRLTRGKLKYLYPNFRLASEVLEEKIQRLKNSGARILLNTEVEEITGFVGNFTARLRGAVSEEVRVGTIILAFGADLYQPEAEYRYRELENVITIEELERLLCEQEDEFRFNGEKPRSVSFIMCVGSRDPSGYTGCSRYCCPTAIKQAIILNRMGIDVTIFYRDIRTVSAGAEEMYREARGRGVLFVRIPSEGDKPEVLGSGRAEFVRCFDALLNREIEVPTDLVVLATGMRPREPETSKFRDMLKTSIGLDGFFLERHPELAPVETAVEGVFIAGTLQGPKDIVDTVAQASAAAAKASVLLAYDKVAIEPTVSVVNEVKCRGCGKCVEICLYHAPALIEIDTGTFVSRINPSLCKGCGTCASWCPSGAITAKHFTDKQVYAMIDALFETETVASSRTTSGSHSSEFATSAKEETNN